MGSFQTKLRTSLLSGVQLDMLDFAPAPETIKALVLTGDPKLIGGLSAAREWFDATFKTFHAMNTSDEARGYDAVVIDLDNLAEMEQRNVLAVVAARFPNLQMLVISSHDQAPIHLPENIWSYVPKSFGADAIVESIRLYSGHNNVTSSWIEIDGDEIMLEDDWEKQSWRSRVS